MTIALPDAWKQFEKYVNEKGYTRKLLGAYVLCNKEGKQIKLISIRLRDYIMIVWEDGVGYYERDLE